MIALLTLGFTSCSQEEDFAPQGGDGQEITILMRTATEGEDTAAETFTSPFTLELWNDGVHTTHPMTYTEGTGWSPIKVDKLGTSVTALAYCGNTVTVTSLDNYSVELTEDQSEEDAFNAADVMIATGTVDENHSLSLHFEHYFAKMTFNVTIATEFDETDEITTFQVMTADGKTVSAYVDGKTVAAILPAGTYSDGTFLNVAVANGTLLSVNVPTDGLTLTAGTHYTFALKVGKNKVTIEQISTDNIGNPFGSGWDNDSETDLI